MYLNRTSQDPSRRITSVKDVPVLRALERLVTLFAPPTVTQVSDFLAASFRTARGVCNGFTLDVHYRSTDREEICFVRHAELRFFDVAQVTHFVAAEAAKR